MSKLVSICCCSLLAAAWLVSNHYMPWVASQSEVLAAAAAVLLPAATLGSTSRLYLSKAAMFFAALALIPLAQVGGGLIYFGGDGWIAALYLLCVGWVVVWSARTAAQGEAWVVSFATAILAGALVSAVIALVQRFEIDVGALRLYLVDLRPGSPPGANLAQPNQLATLLGLGLAALMLLFEARRVRGWLAASGAAILVVAMALTLSRTPLLLFATGFVTVGILRRRVALLTSPLWVLAFASLWVCGYLALPYVAASLQLQPPLETLQSRAHIGPREVIWPQLLEAVRLHPWVGYGWNQVSVAQITVAAEGPRTRLVEHSHNLLLDLAIWNGVPLALLIVGFAGWWLWRVAFRLNSARGVFALLVLLLLLAHAAVEFPLDYLYFLVPFAIAIGILEHEVGARPVILVHRSAAMMAAMAAAVVALLATVDYFRVEEAFRVMRFTVARIGRSVDSQASPILCTEYTQLAAFYRFALLHPRAGMTSKEIEWMRKVTFRYPYASSLYRYAMALALNGQLDAADLTLMQMRMLHGERPYQSARTEIAQLAASDFPSLRAMRVLKDSEH